jgi:hypothetical protein
MASVEVVNRAEPARIVSYQKTELSPPECLAIVTINIAMVGVGLIKLAMDFDWLALLCILCCIGQIGCLAWMVLQSRRERAIIATLNREQQLVVETSTSDITGMEASFEYRLHQGLFIQSVIICAVQLIPGNRGSYLAILGCALATQSYLRLRAGRESRLTVVREGLIREANGVGFYYPWEAVQRAEWKQGEFIPRLMLTTQHPRKPETFVSTIKFHKVSESDRERLLELIGKHMAVIRG